MELQEIKTYMETGTEEVQDYIKSLITVDRVSTFLITDDGKKLLQPMLDTYHTKCLESFKNGSMQKLISEAITKANPLETTEQKTIRDLTDRLNKSDADKLRNELSNTARSILTSKKLPTEDILNLLVGSDEETTINNINSFEKVFASSVEAIIAERLKTTYTPPKGGNGVVKNPWAKDTFNLTEQGKIMNENPTLASQLMAQV